MSALVAFQVREDLLGSLQNRDRRTGRARTVSSASSGLSAKGRLDGGTAVDTVVDQETSAVTGNLKVPIPAPRPPRDRLEGDRSRSTEPTMDERT